jgi:ATP synthase protein I
MLCRAARGGLMKKPEKTEREDAALRERLDKLSGELKAQRDAPQPTDEVTDLVGKGAGQAMNLGFRVLTEFVSGIIVGGIIGWLLDHWLATSPAFLIIFLMLGAAAGFWNVYRIAVPRQRDGGRPPSGSSGN